MFGVSWSSSNTKCPPVALTLAGYLTPKAQRAACNWWQPWLPHESGFWNGRLNTLLGWHFAHATPVEPPLIARNKARAATAQLAQSKSKMLEKLELNEVVYDEPAVRIRAPQIEPRKGIALLDAARAFAFAFAVLALAEVLGRLSRMAFGDMTGRGAGWQVLQVLCTNRFVLITTVTLVLATAFARPLAKVNGPEEFGAYLLLLFLFTLGLPADFISVITQAPLFFVFCGIIAVANLVFTLAAGKLLRLNLEELLLAVNANLGGAPSAAAMAVSTGWSRLVLPGLLVGIWGYVIGTPIGIMMVELLRR